MSKIFISLLLSYLIILGPGQALANDTGKKPRVIVMTDGEIDDQSSMIRFLLYTCDVDLQAIIETNSLFQRHGHSKEDWYEKQLAAYERVYPNLIKHNPGYPTADVIRQKSFVGDEDITHLDKLHYWVQGPGHAVEYMPDNWPNTPGSDKIVQILLSADPSPVYIQAWGGGNTASKAFYKLKTQYPADYDRAISKVVMYNIWYQDDAGNYIETYHPKVTMIYNNSFFGTWDYNSLPHTTDFVTNHIKNNHGPLGALYPQSYISEGDTPSLLYTLNNGLRNHENPTFGGWGGRFSKNPNYANGYIDAADDGDVKKPLRRWIEQANSDFRARMDWTVAQSFSGANHEPQIQVNVSDNITVKSGQTVTLSAEGTTDPDGNGLSYRWWQYKDAGSYPNLVTIQNATAKTASLVVPTVDTPKTLHMILEVTDNGSPALVSYKRIVLTLTKNDGVTTVSPAPACSATGTILREQWNNIGGNLISSIPLNTAPASSSQLTLFEGPTNTADNYGSRIRGYICAPLTGSYTFFIAGDDDSELWLSTDSNPANKRKIAGLTGYTNPREWNSFASQQSGTITLEAGRKYYIEALQKDGNGPDNLAVGWQLPNGTLERPIAGSRLSPFEVTTTQATAVNCSATGTILREQWNNIGGNLISSIPLNTAPASSQQLTLFEGPTNTADYYGSRIRGYICAPLTGSYTFFIAGDDDSELWLSTDSNPANKRKIAGLTGYTNPREWNKFASQQSGTITLEAGRKYYIEALQKDGNGPDNLAVGWQLPNGTLERPIAGSRLSPYVSGSNTLLSEKNAETDIMEQVADADKSFNVYPNPFRQTVNLAFTSPATENVVVQVYTLQGNLLETLHKGTAKAGQRQEVTWDGSKYATGVYLAKLTYGSKVVYKRLLLQR